MNIDKQKIFEKLDFIGLCAYCGQKITIHDMQVDKMVSNIESFDNLMPCCYECKSYKGNKDIEEFREQLKNMHKRIIENNQGIAMNYGIIKINAFVGKFLFERW
jgi:5-methylcytosine-specific restriction endonuclease McrA